MLKTLDTETFGWTACGVCARRGLLHGFCRTLTLSLPVVVHNMNFIVHPVTKIRLTNTTLHSLTGASRAAASCSGHSSLAVLTSAAHASCAAVALRQQQQQRGWVARPCQQGPAPQGQRANTLPTVPASGATRTYNACRDMVYYPLRRPFFARGLLSEWQFLRSACGQHVSITSVTCERALKDRVRAITSPRRLFVRGGSRATLRGRRVSPRRAMWIYMPDGDECLRRGRAS